MKNPKISIITITYNSEKHLEEAMLSVINQPYENKEYIIIDGASTDGTLNIVNKYRDKIAYFVSEPDKGISDAFNKGIKVATGDLIGICNSDDKLGKNALLHLAESYAPEIDIYRGICLHWEGKENSIYAEKPAMRFPHIPIDMRVAHPATFVAKRAYTKYGGYDMELKYAMDFDFLQRCYLLNVTMKYIEFPLAYFRLGGVSQENDIKRLKELLNILRKNGAKYWQVRFFSFYYHMRLLLKHFLLIFGKKYKNLILQKAQCIH